MQTINKLGRCVVTGSLWLMMAMGGCQPSSPPSGNTLPDLMADLPSPEAPVPRFSVSRISLPPAKFHWNLAQADFNLDGKQDLVVESEESVYILSGDGAGGFRLANTPTKGYYDTYMMAVGDFNLDGKPDVAIDSQIWLGDGSGGFSSIASALVGPHAAGYAVGDFNRDGVPDLVGSNYSVRKVSLWSGDGRGGFSLSSLATRGDNMCALLEDLDRDGNPDLILPYYSNSSLDVFRGDGRGGFSMSQNIIVLTIPRTIVSADFNHDGKTDVVVMGESKNAAILLGDGAGGFPERTLIPIDSKQWPLTVGDFNSDGRLDFANANTDTDSVILMLGDGSGKHFYPTVVPVGEKPYALASGDFDGDGRTDLAVVGAGGLYVLLNRP